MEPEAIIEALKVYRVPHERIAAVIGRDRSAATKMLAGSRSIKANEVAPLTALVREVVSEQPVPPPPGPDAGATWGVAERGGDMVLVPPGHDLNGLYVRGEVRAGAWLETGDIDQREPEIYPAAPDPRFPRAAQWLRRVRGDSMNALTNRKGESAGIFEGDLVQLVDAMAIDYRLSDGDVVEVERVRFDGREHEITLKQVHITAEGEKLLCPRSNNPRWQDPIRYQEGIQEGEEIEVVVRGLMLQHIRPWR